MTEQVSAVGQDQPRIRQIGVGDLSRALSSGWSDYMAKPSHIAVLGIIYPLLGLLLLWWAYGNAFLPLMFPLISGFALIGPFAALVFYELSRRREMGQESTWQAALRVIRSPAMGSVLVMALVLVVIFVIWLWTALAIYNAIMPPPEDTIRGFLGQIFGTAAGMDLILVGCCVGLLFAIAAFTISVVSFPLLLDRRVNVRTAIATSARAVLVNPFPMAVWALIIVALLIVGAIPLLAGLAVVVPLLGHASWHLYRAVVEA